MENGSDRELAETLQRFDRELPKFVDGRIDYTNSNEAPVVIIFLRYKDEILLVKRSGRVANYNGKWNTVAGFLDRVRPLEEDIYEELKEELGLDRDQIGHIHKGKSHVLDDKSIGKKWIVFPVIVDTKELPTIKIDWEHTAFKWIKPKELADYDTVTDLEKTYKLALE